MTCRQIRLLLSVRRECTAQEKAVVEDHLVACPACLGVARAYELMDRRLGRLPEPAPVLAMPSTVQARIVNKEAIVKTGLSMWHRKALWGFALIAVVALAVAVAMAWLGPDPLTGFVPAAGPSAVTPDSIAVPTPLPLPTEISHPLDYQIGEAIRFLGYDLPEEKIKPGDTLQLTLYWRAFSEADASIMAFVHLVDEEDDLWVQSDEVPGRGVRLSAGWPVGEVIVDKRTMLVSAEAPPGEYILVVGMYQAGTGQRLYVIDTSGQPAGDRLALNTRLTLEATAPTATPTTDPSPSGTGHFQWPVSGHVSQPYSSTHLAVDVANQVGAPVLAAEAGTVAEVGRDARHGLYLLLDHGDGYETFYSHLDVALVEAGEAVDGGQRIGLLGETGIATGPHLHFEIHLDGENLNPLDMLPHRDN